jgi:NAD(P)-dependent dehydrogenase (short-subunit alcohol dehydrogenase family)
MLMFRPRQKKRREFSRGKGLDILINNIGIGQSQVLPPADTGLAVFREQFEINVIGTQLVTIAMLPLLRGKSWSTCSLQLFFILTRVALPSSAPYILG